MFRNTFLVLGISALGLAPMAAQAQVSFLTGPQKGEPQALALNYLTQNFADLGLTAEDAANYRVSDHYMTRHNQTTHVYLVQQHDGIDVFTGMININVARDGSIINLGNRFVADLASKVNSVSPALSAETAISRAASHLNVALPAAPIMLEFQGGPDFRGVFAADGFTNDSIPAQLVYEPIGDGVRLAWHLVLDMADSSDWWEMRVDAESGEVLAKTNRTSHKDAAQQSGAAQQNGLPDFTYRVVPFPFESIEEVGGSHSLVTNPHDPVASPFGWHDTDGDIQPDFTDTRGNNVEAQDDIDGNNSGGSRPSGGAGDSLTFDIPFDADSEPEEAQNLDSAIVNLFYWNNITHDYLYHYGFDEVSGNFQNNTYGNGGVGGDPVQADAQDARNNGASDNANFSTPPDGFDPRMQMFVFLAPPVLTVTAPPSIAGEYDAGRAQFGAALSEAGFPGQLETVDDGSASPTEGCNALVGFTAGRIAVIDRGSCEFGVKSLNAEDAGATAVIIVNNQGDNPPGLGAGTVGDQVTIPVISLGQSDGALIKAEIALGQVDATIFDAVIPNRDSDFDNLIIAHEYGHGLSNRLVGGPSMVACLGNPEQMGEGWSDYLGIEMTAKITDTPEQIRGMGPYAAFQPTDGTGIRNFPYTTDIALNPQSYLDVGSTNIPHGVGEIWAQALWDMHWNLVEKFGFDEDLYTGTGGNNLSMQLVVDGLKLLACNPTFVTGRDAILLADMNNNGGANQCEIWDAFAKRGVGVDAVDNGSGVGGEVNSFEVPEECLTSIFSDGFELGNTSAWSNTSP